jgi:ABC-type Na+ efflux pump permease subunit
MNSPVTPYVLAGRILSIIGMGFTAAAAILLAIIPSWWAAVSAAAFVPFFALIVLVERYSAKNGLIGPEVADPDAD